MAKPRLLVLSAALAIACRPSSAPVPTSAQTSAYVLRLGADTLAIDQFTRVGERIEGTLVTHLPRTVVTRYAVTLSPTTGMASLLEYNNRLPSGAMLPAGTLAPLRNVTITFGGDSAVRRDQRDTVITQRAAAPNAFPYINYSIAFFQLPVSALRAASKDSAAWSIYTGGRTTTSMIVKRVGSSRYTVDIGGFPYLVLTDGGGVVQSVDGARTTQHFVAMRQSSIDGPGLAAAWAQRESAAAAPAALSVRDTTRARIGGVELMVDYGRPLARGRKVFGANGVLNDTIWRTGANQATQFRTSAAIRVGGVNVPPGTYTLWTLAIPGRYQLIINRQTGQWGTIYDAKQDLARVPLTLAALPQVIERFTIAMDATGERSGVLTLRWDTTELSVPITIP